MARMLPHLRQEEYIPELPPQTGAGKESRPLPHRMDRGRAAPLDGQTLATYKDSTRS